MIQAGPRETGDRDVRLREITMDDAPDLYRWRMDETSRPMEMWSWPASGNPTRDWAINPSAWGFDTIGFGSGVYQPVLFAGQYQDRDTTAYLDDGATIPGSDNAQ